MHGLLVLFRKELTDHLKSARFLLMLALLTLTSMASLYGALGSVRDAATESSEFIFFNAVYHRRKIHSLHLHLPGLFGAAGRYRLGF